MAYRDDLEAAHARIAALERENADLKKGVSTALTRIQGSSLALVGPQTAQRRWLGGPTKLAFQQQIDGELPDAAFALVVDRVRDFFGKAGELSVLPGSITWSINATRDSREVEFRLTVRTGVTTLRLSENLSTAAAGMFGGLGALAGVASVALIGALGPVGVAAASGGAVSIWQGLRMLMGKISRGRNKQLQDLMVELVAIATDEIKRVQSKNE